MYLKDIVRDCIAERFGGFLMDCADPDTGRSGPPEDVEAALQLIGDKVLIRLLHKELMVMDKHSITELIQDEYPNMIIYED